MSQGKRCGEETVNAASKSVSEYVTSEWEENGLSRKKKTQRASKCEKLRE